MVTGTSTCGTKEQLQGAGETPGGSVGRRVAEDSEEPTLSPDGKKLS